MASTYTTKSGDMWDAIARREYGAENGMNALIQANPAHIRQVVFPAGIALTVPDYTAPVSSNLPPWRR